MNLTPFAAVLALTLSVTPAFAGNDMPPPVTPYETSAPPEFPVPVLPRLRGIDLPPIRNEPPMTLPVTVDVPSAVLGGLMGAAIALAAAGVASWRRQGRSS